VSPDAPVLELEDLVTHFPIRRGLLGRVVGQVRAVDGVSFAIRTGETLGLVGESGCGKSTVGRTALRLVEPTSGTIRLEGEDVTRLDRKAMRSRRRRLQVVFQDPYSSLNLRMRAEDIVAEPLRNFGIPASAERIAGLFERVGLRPEQMAHYPHEFSGGQRQRLVIAKALALDPAIVVCDEPVSALDVSVQAQIVNLLAELQDSLGIAYLFIAHDLALVEHISHRVAVMYLGKIVELADKDLLFGRPMHPYTEALLSAVPVPDPSARAEPIILSGDVPSSSAPPPGCRFHTRCPYAFDRCRREEPRLREVRAGQLAACHLHDEQGDRVRSRSNRNAGGLGLVHQISA
jgi:oligopeptide/dipeptide ABC transporter ATP-binding protein